VVDDAVDHRRGDDWAAEYAGPAGKRQVAGENERGVLVAARDELEEQASRRPRCRLSHSTRNGMRVAPTSQRPSSGLAAKRPAIPVRTAAAALLSGLRRACSSKHAMNSAASSSRG
jgi:hypothetical protein